MGVGGSDGKLLEKIVPVFLGWLGWRCVLHGLQFERRVSRCAVWNATYTRRRHVSCGCIDCAGQSGTSLHVRATWW